MRIAISNIADKFNLKFKRLSMPKVPKCLEVQHVQPQLRGAQISDKILEF